MDKFVFKTSTQAVAAGHDPMEHDAVWGTDGASRVVSDQSFDEPILFFDEPALGFDEPALGFEDPTFG